MNIRIDSKEINEFLSDFKNKFIPELKSRLEANGHKDVSIHVHPSSVPNQFGAACLDVIVEDSTGRQGHFYVDPVLQTYTTVFYTR